MRYRDRCCFIKCHILGRRESCNSRHAVLSGLHQPLRSSQPTAHHHTTCTHFYPPHHSHSTINHVISFPVLFSPAIQSHSVPIFAPLCQSMLHSISHNISLPRTPFPPTQSPVRTNTKNTTITILPSPTRLPPSLGFHYTSKNH